MIGPVVKIQRQDYHFSLTTNAKMLLVYPQVNKTQFAGQIERKTELICLRGFKSAYLFCVIREMRMKIVLYES